MTITPGQLSTERATAITQMMASQPFRDLLASLEIKAAALQARASTIDDADQVLANAKTPALQSSYLNHAAVYLSATHLLRTESTQETLHYGTATLHL